VETSPAPTETVSNKSAVGTSETEGAADGEVVGICDIVGDWLGETVGEAEGFSVGVAKEESGKVEMKTKQAAGLFDST
jgi:hypothetical protein